MMCVFVELKDTTFHMMTEETFDKLRLRDVMDIVNKAIKKDNIPVSAKLWKTAKAHRMDVGNVHIDITKNSVAVRHATGVRCYGCLDCFKMDLKTYRKLLTFESFDTIPEFKPRK